MARPSSPYIVGPTYDLLFFIFSPWLGLALSLTLFRILFVGDHPTEVSPRFEWSPLFHLMLGPLLTQAHIVLVFFRSHLNAGIFRRHKERFTAVPLVMIIGMMVSLPFLVTVRVVSQLWDIYHSSLQTFGLARIYDHRQGNNPAVGRRLDIALAHVIYIGPLLAGINLFHALSHFLHFSDVSWDTLASVPLMAVPYARPLRFGVMIGGAAFIAMYVLGYARLYRRGYHFSWQKIALLANTAAVSTAAWGFLPPTAALLTVNFFHAWQYFGIVWWSEGVNLRSLLRLRKARAGKAIALVLMLAVTFGYATLHHRWSGSSRFLTSLVLTCACMHFWWDGFIWSVRRNDV